MGWKWMEMESFLGVRLVVYSDLTDVLLIDYNTLGSIFGGLLFSGVEWGRGRVTGGYMIFFGRLKV
jgi:hypothetical protein